MKFAAVDPGVNPRQQVNLIILWTVFNVLACLGFTILLVSGLFIRRVRGNPVLLSLYAVFVVATAAGPLLTWTGYAMSYEVPIGLCIVSGAFGSSWSLAQVASTFALVLKVGEHVTCQSSTNGDDQVWSHALLISYPQSKVLRWTSSSPLVRSYILDHPQSGSPCYHSSSLCLGCCRFRSFSRRLSWDRFIMKW
jgi:hypothetical protein